MAARSSQNRKVLWNPVFAAEENCSPRPPSTLDMVAMNAETFADRTSRLVCDNSEEIAPWRRRSPARDAGRNGVVIALVRRRAMPAMTSKSMLVSADVAPR